MTRKHISADKVAAILIDDVFHRVARDERHPIRAFEPVITDRFSKICGLPVFRKFVTGGAVNPLPCDRRRLADNQS